MFRPVDKKDDGINSFIVFVVAVLFASGFGSIVFLIMVVGGVFDG